MLLFGLLFPVKEQGVLESRKWPGFFILFFTKVFLEGSKEKGKKESTAFCLSLVLLWWTRRWGLWSQPGPEQNGRNERGVSISLAAQRDPEAAELWGTSPHTKTSISSTFQNAASKLAVLLHQAPRAPWHISRSQRTETSTPAGLQWMPPFLAQSLPV